MLDRILLVDDDPFILQAFQRSLRKLFNLEIARGPQEGISAIMNNGPYAVIVTDLNMPEVDGVDFLVQARQLSPNSVRILLTGSDPNNRDVRNLEKGLVYRCHSKLDSNADFIKLLRESLEVYNQPAKKV
jgi:CheY-like chemotaxis protein